MEKLQYKICLFCSLLVFTAAVNAQENKQKPPTAPSKTDAASQHKKEARYDSARVYKEANAEKKHKYYDSVRVYKQSNLELKHKRADSARVYKDAAMKLKHKHADSVRHLKMDANKDRKEAPSKKHLEKVKTKKVVMSIPFQPGATLMLYNIMHRVTVLATDKDKVTMVATVRYTGESTLTDREWFEKMDLSLTQNGSNVEARSGELSTGALKSYDNFDVIYNGAIIFDSLGNAIAFRSSNDLDIILYVPKNADVNVESKHADITFQNNMGNIEAKMTNGRLSMLNADQIKITAAYVRVDAGKIKKAKVELTNGQLRAGSISNLTLATENSAILLEKVDSLNIQDSQADYFNIRQAGHITGKKSFGDMQLVKLTGSMNIDGQNASMKVETISPTASLVKINNQYADLKLSVDALKNYLVDFEGRGGKVVAPFKKTTVSKTSFSSSVGNAKSNPTVFQLHCNDCMVNFN